MHSSGGRHQRKSLKIATGHFSSTVGNIFCRKFDCKEGSLRLHHGYHEEALRTSAWEANCSRDL